jgi:NAD+ kinase
MNNINKENLTNIIDKSQKITLKSLTMKTTNINNENFESIAFNEVSIMRQSHQASKIQIMINGIERMKELICDGVLVSTAAGSTAYNLSAHGTIIPLDSKLLALTPISAFRPRRWRGALLSENLEIKLNIIDSNLRPVSVTADHSEFRNIKNVEIKSNEADKCTLLFDNEYSMEERVLKEQFIE